MDLFYHVCFLLVIIELKTDNTSSKPPPTETPMHLLIFYSSNVSSGAQPSKHAVLLYIIF